MLRELSITTPDLLDNHVLLLHDLVWNALWDPALHIREAAAGVFAGCLSIATIHDKDFQSEIFTLALSQVQSGLQQDTEEVVHGSLLAMKELFDQQSRDDVCSYIVHITIQLQ